jgi:hypothetical protein
VTASLGRRRDVTSTSAATSRGPPTGSPSWRTCCSPTSCSRACRQRALARSRWPRIPATRAPSCGGRPRG